MTHRIFLLLLFGLVSLTAGDALAQEPQWNGTIIAVGQQRARIQSTEIIDRPYRPFHFYGNTVRRRHYRGSAIPLPRDFYQGLRALARR